MSRKKKRKPDISDKFIFYGVIFVIVLIFGLYKAGAFEFPTMHDVGKVLKDIALVAGIMLISIFVFTFIVNALSKKNEQGVQDDRDIPDSGGTDKPKHYDGISYERYVADKLRKMGYYAIRFTPRTGDHGADILATAPDGVQCAIQCKRYQSNVGNKAVQEALAGMTYYGCGRAIVATNSRFTPQAKDDAWRMGVKLFEEF